MRLIASATLLALSASISSATAQAPLTMQTTAGTNRDGLLAAGAPNNPWVGASLGYRFGSGDRSWDQLVGNGSITFLNKNSKWMGWRAPVMGTVASLSLDDLKDPQAKLEKLESGDGLTVGVFPYHYFRSDAADNNFFTFYAQATVKVNSSTDTITKGKHYLGQFRVGPGFEAQLLTKQSHPVTLAVSPILGILGNSVDYKRVFGKERSLVQTIEITGTVRLWDGVGFLAEGVVPFGQTAGDSKATFRGGLLFAGKSGN